MKKNFLFLYILAISTGNLSGQSRPNIIFIFSDDHDADAISAYNSRLIQTPGIDRLAREGMLFTHNFVTNSICAPARATILTGKFSHLNGLRDNATDFDTAQYVFPRQLRNAGYQTAIFGKWHLNTPPSGFDHWEILPGQGNYYRPAFINQQLDTISYPDDYATDLITRKAIHWMDQRDRSKPFLLMVHNKAPHRNWWPEVKFARQFAEKKIPEPATLLADSFNRGKAYREQQMRILEDMSLVVDLKVDPAYLMDIPHLKPTGDEIRSYEYEFGLVPEGLRLQLKAIFAKRGELLKKLKPAGKDLLRLKYQWYMQDYLACVAGVDENVSLLLDYLDQNKLNENTIVVYSSDQGFYLGENGWFDKRFMYDVSIQSPLLVRWTGHISPGERSDALVQNIDMAPTFLDLAGQTIPAEIQGISLKDIFTGKKSAPEREYLYYHYYEFPQPHHVYPHLGIRGKRYKLIYFYTVNEWELYDLEKDREERLNLINDPDYQEVRKKLRRQLEEARNIYLDHEPAGQLK